MKFVTIFKAVTRNWIRSRSGLFFSILFPILLLIVFGAIFSGVGGTSTYSLWIQNLDRTSSGQPTDLSSGFVSALNSTKTFSIHDVPSTENATDYVREQLGPLGGNMRILIISKGFQDDLTNGTLKVRVGISYDTLNMSFQYFSANLTDTQKAMIGEGLVQMQQLNSSMPDVKTSLTIMMDPSDQSSGIVQSIVSSVANAFNFEMIGAKNVITFNQTSVSNTQFRSIDFYIPGITAAFIMTNGIIGLTSTNTEFKRRGIVKRLSITPLTKIDWVIGCILSQTLLNIMLTFIMIGAGWLIFNVRVIPDLFTVALIFVGSVMFAGIGMTLSGVIKDIEAASAIGNAIAFPMMFLSGTYFPIEIMPTYLQSVSKALPLTYFSEGLKASMITKFAEGLWFNLAVVGALAIGFIVLGAFVTRWKEK